MNLINKKVLHRTLGEGKVISCNDDYIKIDFESGEKKFIFPDVFGKYMTLKDQKVFDLVKKRLEENEKEKEKKALQLQQERMLAREHQRILEQKRQVKTTKIHPELQSVFWCKDKEEEKVFEEWKVFIGKVKNGAKKGQLRKLARMNQKSACLLTKREADMLEKNRTILGVFMAASDFNGKTNEDGYIPAHPDYRLKLSKEESEKMLFWNYYSNKSFPERKTWNSGRQRYFDNIWMAQILRDIVDLREGPEEKEYVQNFLQYFCTINRININELPEASGH